MESDIEAIATNVKNTLATAVICKVTAVNHSTINCQSVINKTAIIDGELKDIPFPEFLDVPVIWQQGGGSYTTYPIAVGDYCVCIVIERSFDHFYLGQDNKPPAEIRTHDYSDCVAIMGICNQAGEFAIPKKITHKGDTLFNDNVEIEKTLHVKLNVVIDGDLIVGGSISTGTKGQGSATINGSLAVKGGDIKADNISLKNHVHGGVVAGGDDTGVSK